MLDRALQRVRAAKDEIAGSLRIAAPRSGFAQVLWPVIDAFCRQYPEIQPDLHLDDQVSNWVQERADVGFRFGAPPEEGLIARKLFPAQLIVCASPAYLERHGVPQSLDDLATHRCSVFRHPATGQVYPWFLNVDGEVIRRDLPPALSINDVEVELRAVLDGQVIAQLAGISAAPHIRAGRIRPVLLQHMTDHMGVYLYYGSRRAQPTRVRKFIDFAAERLTEQSGLCADRPRTPGHDVTVGRRGGRASSAEFPHGIACVHRFTTRTTGPKPPPLRDGTRRPLFAETENGEHREGENSGKRAEWPGSALRTTCRSRASAGATADVTKARAESGL